MEKTSLLCLIWENRLQNREKNSGYVRNYVMILHYWKFVEYVAFAYLHAFLYFLGN